MYNYDSNKGEIIAPCKHCGEYNEMKAWYNLDSSKYPEQKRQLLKKELFLYKCEKCDAVYMLAYEMMYHDAENKVIIYVDPMSKYTKQIKKKIKKQKKEFGKDYRFRIVKSASALQEKAALFEHKYDDRVIELLVGELVINTSCCNENLIVDEVRFFVGADDFEAVLFCTDCKTGEKVEMPNSMDYATYKINERNTYMLMKIKDSLFIDFDWCVEQRKRNKKRIERKLRKYS